MHATQLLHNMLNKSLTIHKTRLAAVFKAVNGLVSKQKLTLTAIGRGIKNPKAKPKNNILCVNRLLGNKHLHEEYAEFYQAVSHHIIGQTKHPLIIVDWSPLAAKQYHILRAAVPVNGRALVIYEEVHPQSLYNNAEVHKQFLAQLKKALPKDCQPIIITDAGFISPWFKAVKQLGWHFIGRIRGASYSLDNKKTFIPCKKLHPEAGQKVKHIGYGYIAKRNPTACNIYTIKNKEKGRINKNKLGKRQQSTMSKRAAKTQTDPWVIVTSLPHTANQMDIAIKYYSRRMEIEEGFRDLKSQRTGLSFKEMGTKCIKRIQILLLVAMLAILGLWLMGLAAKEKKLHYDYQANTVRDRNVLSVFYLGCQLVYDGIQFLRDELFASINKVKTVIYEASYA